MVCIIALNVGSLVAVVVGNLAQPRVPECIKDSRNTFVRNAKKAVRPQICNTQRNVANASRKKKERSLIELVSRNYIKDVVSVSTQLVLFA